jgi:hypothetical protein
MWYSKHWNDPAGSGVEAAIPSGDKLGSVASSDSRLYMRISLWPPMRRFFPVVVSGIVIKVTWLAVKAVVAFL